MSDWQRAQADAAAEQRIEEIEYDRLDPSICHRRDPETFAELTRLQGGMGESRWRG